MAYIIKRGSNYRITVTLGRDKNGKKIVKTTTYKPQATTPMKAKKEAEAFAQKFEEQVKNGNLLIDTTITFMEFSKIWEENWLPTKTPTVRDNYKDVLRVRVMPYLGEMKLSKIKATHIDNIINAEKADKLAPKTIRMTFTVINSVMRYAYKKEYVKENPCLRCDDLPPIKMKKIDELRYFTLEQAKCFLNVALTKTYYKEMSSHKRTLMSSKKEYTVGSYKEAHTIPLQWKTYFYIAICGACRRGEMCALTWKDINSETKTITINKSLANTKEGQIIKEPKTEASNREIVLPEICFTLLEKLHKEQIEKALSMGTAWMGHRNIIDKDGKKTDCFDDNNVFIQYDGNPINLSTPTHKFGEIIEMYNKTCDKEEEKLPKIRLHDLRHTSLTLLLSENTDIETVARRAGHSKASVTLDIYGHYLPDKDKKASDSLSDMFGS